MENDGNITVLQALAMTGGASRTASMNHARLIRKGEHGYSDISVQLKRLLRARGGDIALQAEYILDVPESATKSAAPCSLSVPT
jgi:protein involved in polysaccharide export with SLBB domain